MHKAQLGDRVGVQYFRISEQGVANGKRPGRKKCEFTVGGSEVIPTLSLGVVGMTPGDRKRLTLQPKEAYGNVRRRLIRPIPRARFPKHLVLQVGKRLTVGRGNVRRRRRVTVVEIRLDSVLVDGNHPLAGKIIELEVTLISLVSSHNANPNRP
jgi:peptidylprolyl isomerase